ncbi:acetylornithine deacetylase [soil metagenome]
MGAAVDAEALSARALGLLDTLVAFDTTSRNSNLELIAFVEGELDRQGVASHRVQNADGSKSNLYATLGPMAEGGVVLSGHTDVVPVDGQAWSSPAFTLTERGGKLYGRGTCDMKGFLALALAAAPDLLSAPLHRPVHLAFSYDEEVGCIGAPDMIREIVRELPRPALVVVGEPTNMQAASAHKGITTYRVTVNGKEAHSSQTHLGASAIMAAIPLLSELHALAARMEKDVDGGASLFVPAHSTLTVGMIHGGTAGNILARECSFLFDLRTAPGIDPLKVLAPFLESCQATGAALKARYPQAGVAVVRRSLTPALAPEQGGEAERFARHLAGDNGPERAVPFATEAGQFQEAGFSTVICGPGSIDQAHQADEFLEVAQLQRGAQFMGRLVESLRA